MKSYVDETNDDLKNALQTQVNFLDVISSVSALANDNNGGGGVSNGWCLTVFSAT
jgi:hypothetical protein